MLGQSGEHSVMINPPMALTGLVLADVRWVWFDDHTGFSLFYQTVCLNLQFWTQIVHLFTWLFNLVLITYN